MLKSTLRWRCSFYTRSRSNLDVSMEFFFVFFSLKSIYVHSIYILWANDMFNILCVSIRQARLVFWPYLHLLSFSASRFLVYKQIDHFHVSSRNLNKLLLFYWILSWKYILVYEGLLVWHSTYYAVLNVWWISYNLV